MVKRDLIFSFMKVILLIIGAFILVSCGTIRIKDKLIGNTKIERKFDENGALIYYKKMNTKLKCSEFGYATHQSYITRTTTKTIKDDKIVELYFQKTKSNYSTWNEEILKSKRIVWDENRKKTVTCTSAK